eukprot:COSAG01_NODE_1999_length_8688_cov_6.237280_8_plen_163_part_00
MESLPPAVAATGHAVARGAHAGGAGERWLLGRGVGGTAGTACTTTQSSHRAAAAAGAQASIALLAVARQLLMRYPRCACLLEEEGEDDAEGGDRPRPRPGRRAQPGGGGHQRSLLPGGGGARLPPSRPPAVGGPWTRLSWLGFAAAARPVSPWRVHGERVSE